MRRVLTLALAGAAALSFSSTALAAVNPGPGTCDPNDTNPNAISCVGDYTGNIFNNQTQPPPSNVQIITDALAFYGITYSGNIGDYQGFTDLNGSQDLTSLFGLLTGTYVFGIHYGGGAGGGTSAFYQITFDGQPLKLDIGQSSNIYLFSPRSVPEPATWAMMLLGFGGIGIAMRRNRRRNTTALMQVA